MQPGVSRPVVQALPGRDGMALNAALARLASDPRNTDALIEAGNAALVMGDVDAATGFYRRADQVSPGNPRVKAGLAGAMVRSGDPFGALPLFEEAERAGALDSSLAGDRGLAYDLVGDNATAQRYYRQSLARMPSGEVVRRLALSLAISGDKNGADQIISPLLSQRDLAAWRTRAFALAILGQTEEAVSVASRILPADLASGMAPYLRYMPRLTKAQQAAAASFGLFPRASEIGRDDPRVAQYAPPPRRTSVAAGGAVALQGEPLGRKSRRDRDRDRRSAGRQQQDAAELASVAPAPSLGGGKRTTQVARAAPPEPQPARRVAAAPSAIAQPATAPFGALAAAEAPVPTRSRPDPAATPAQPRAPAPASTLALVLPPVPAPAQRPAAPAVTPGFTLTPAGPVGPPASASAIASPPPLKLVLPTPAPPTPAPAAPPPSVPATAAPEPVTASPPAAVPAASVPRSLAAAFAEFERPTIDITPANGAVDLRRIKPARPEPRKPAEPPKPSHPSRIWVQVATGRDKAALAGDWRRMVREASDALRGKAAAITGWGQTNRLLTGPFPSEAAANSFITQLRRADVNGAFVWTSPAGQVVDALSGAAPRR